VLGSIAAGFLLIPWLGMLHSVMAVSILALVVGSMAVLSDKGSKFLLKIPVLAIAGIVFLTCLPILKMDTRMILYSKSFKEHGAYRKELLYYKEGRAFAVSVVRNNRQESRWIYTDRFPAALTDPAAKYMQMLGHLPMLLHENPQEVLVICLGTGTTCGSVGTYEPRRLDIVDISSEVVEAAKKHFLDVNLGVLDKPFAHMHVQDGRQFVLTTENHYDVISLEPLFPHTPAAINFYTRNFYELCKKKLKPGGLMCQWFPIHSQSEDNYKILLKSFAVAFDYCYLWFYENSAMMIGCDKKLWIDFTDFKNRITGAAAQNLHSINLQNSFTILTSFVMDKDAVMDYCKEAPIMTDEFPVIEFREYMARNNPNYTEDVLRSFIKRKQKIFPLLRDSELMSNDQRNLWEAHYRAHLISYLGFIELNKPQYGKAAEFFEQALSHAPQDGMARVLYNRAFFEYKKTAGNFLIRTGDYLQAKKHLQEAMNINPNSPDVNYYFGFCEYCGIEPRNAESYFRKTLSLDSQYWEAHLMLASMYLDQKHWEDAAAEYNAAVEIYPDMPEFYWEKIKAGVKMVQKHGYQVRVPEGK